VAGVKVAELGVYADGYSVARSVEESIEISSELDFM
jgi:hypothetical protein